MIADGRIGQNGSLWLNSGGNGDVSLVIGEGLLNQTYERFAVSDLKDIAGAYALVFGTLRVSQNVKNMLKSRILVSLHFDLSNRVKYIFYSLKFAPRMFLLFPED
jgi:hypothetical protein